MRKVMTAMVPVLRFTLAALLIVLFLPVRTTRSAATLTVTTTADVSGSADYCSLRDAIEAANTNTTVGSCIHDGSTGADTINFSVTGTINLTGVLPTLCTAVDIVGPGATSLTIRRNTALDHRLFDVQSGAAASISGVTLANGHPSGFSSGGAIENAGTLSITAVVFDSNSATADGGAIVNTGTLSVSQSTFVNNHADFDGGGIRVNGGTVTVDACTFTGNTTGYSGAALRRVDGTLTVTNSTLTGNDASLNGGGIEGTSTLKNCTIVGNSAVSGGGGTKGSVSMGTSIVSGNTAASGPDIDGHINSQGHNLIGNSSGASGFVPSDLLNLDPRLGPLQDNGGPTETMALGLVSPGFNAVEDATHCPTTDQRGVARPQGDGCDIGAFESELIHGQHLPLVTK